MRFGETREWSCRDENWQQGIGIVLRSFVYYKIHRFYEADPEISIFELENNEFYPQVSIVRGDSLSMKLDKLKTVLTFENIAALIKRSPEILGEE